MSFTSFGESSVGGGITVAADLHFGAEMGGQLLFMGKSLNQKCVKFIMKIIIPPRTFLPEVLVLRVDVRLLLRKSRLHSQKPFGAPGVRIDFTTRIK